MTRVMMHFIFYSRIMIVDHCNELQLENIQEVIKVNKSKYMCSDWDEQSSLWNKQEVDQNCTI